MKFILSECYFFKYLLGFLMIIVLNLSSNISCKNILKKSREKKLNTNENQYDNINVQPSYTYTNDSFNPRFPSLSYHLQQEDKSSNPITQRIYQDPYTVQIRPNKIRLPIKRIIDPYYD